MSPKRRQTETDPHSTFDGYASPLAGRYASPEMQAIWSARRKFATWRRIWLAVAEAQQACGLDIADGQLAELRDHLEVTDDQIRAAEAYERDLRHDVMAHVHALGDACPKARPIIHLGMTSQDVNDNTELMLIGEALLLIEEKVERLLLALGEAAAAWRDIPTLGLTHFQPAQPTTIGRRIATWANDLNLTLELHDDLFTYDCKLRGFRGTTGTQASFLALFEGDPAKVDEFEARAIWSLLHDRQYLEHDDIRDLLCDYEDMSLMFDNNVDDEDAETAEALRFAASNAKDSATFGGFVRDNTMGLTGQTYPRIYDAMVLAALASIGGVLHKVATDIRLLSGRGELDEPFGEAQIGSSAMPHKRNPMKCERVCALTRFVMNLVPNAYHTAATQWLERTLDDSANRRLTLPEAFLALDGCLDLMRTVAEGLEVHEGVARHNLHEQLPFLASENLMMQAVRLGRDRQDVHEAIRGHAREAAARMKQEGVENDLLTRLKGEPLLAGVDFERAMDPTTHTGRASEQVDEFLRTVIEPLRVNLEGSGAPPTDRGV